MANKNNSKESAINKGLIAVAIALLAGSSSPWWWNEVKHVLSKDSASGEQGITSDLKLTSAAQDRGFIRNNNILPSESWDMTNAKNQSVNCGRLKLNLFSGNLSGVDATAAQEEVGQSFNCFTGTTEDDDSGFNYGGGVFFLKHDFYFYTRRNFIEVRSRFDGEVYPNILGANIGDVSNEFGSPEFGAVDSHYFYKTKYGCVHLWADNDTVASITVHFKLCRIAAKDIEVDL